jgi:ribosomal protein S24E
MELKILKEQPNALLQRVEYQFEITHAAASTPSLDEVRGELSKQLKVPKDRLVVERMHARFGAPRTHGEALAYKNAEAVKRISREHILIRNKLKEKAAPAAPGSAAPAEGPAAPAPEAAPPAAEKPAAKEPAKEKPAEKADKPEKAEKAEKAEKPAAEKGKAKPAKGDAKE